MSLTIGSLFSGIGGLELGLEWAGLGPVLWQVEQDPFCLRKLAWRYPDASRYTDVRAVGASNLAPVDLICGGFPCQDISSAGKRAGLAGARSGLWYEFARVIAECRPRWVVVENVRSGAGKWVDPVRGELERLGYATLPLPIAASDCGAPHERARVFIVGSSVNGNGLRCDSRSELEAVRQHAELTRDLTGASDTHDARGEQQGCAPSDAHRVELREQSRRPISPRPDSDDHGRFVDGVPDQSRTQARHDAQRHGGWSAEPALARVVHGLPGRVDYERALGNSVVPQCAEVVGHVILQLMREAA